MISVIIPVYNVEKYIEKSVKSVLTQTYEDLEIIVVDDGSTDSSGIICDKLAETDSRIKVIHKENGGLSDARNCGLDIATGEYIGFVDGDDYISPYMYEFLLGLLLKYEADMSIVGYESIDENKSPKMFLSDTESVEIIKGKDVFKLVTNLKTENVVAWNKLYKRKIFDQLRYKKNVLHEDQWIIPYIIEKCNKIVKSNNQLYYYVERKDSITGKKVSPKRMWDLLFALENTCTYFKNNSLFKEQKDEADHLCNYVLYYYENAEREFEESKNIKIQLRKYFKKIYRLNENVYSFKQVTYNAFRINPRIGLWIRELRNDLAR